MCTQELWGLALAELGLARAVPVLLLSEVMSSVALATLDPSPSKVGVDSRAGLESVGMQRMDR